MIYPKIPLAQQILVNFEANGIQHIVISPGSRNAPLTIGFANNPFFRCYSIADERCAAFFALGMAQQLNKPVAVVCTSGSALLNYYPAFAEAFYSEIPLIVVSADRPKDKIDIGDGQTIRQENVFANHSIYNSNLTEDATEENGEAICNAIASAIQKRGPVHINAPFEEPLYETVAETSVGYKTIDFSINNEILDSNFDEFKNQWMQSKKKLILIGGMNPNTIEQKYLDILADDFSIIVMTEATSNIHHPKFVTNIDTIITTFSDDDFKFLQPDILLTLGGMIVSKRIKTFLRKYQPKHHWHVDLYRAYDTYGCLSKHFEVSPNTFFEKLFDEYEIKRSEYDGLLNIVRLSRNIAHNEYVAKIPFSDLKVFDKIANHLPDAIQLQISNSSPIRYIQLVDLKPTIEVFCNRGTSGIDGSTSTAIGAAVANPKPTVFITGDVGFFYDSNALWNQYIPKNFKIILINNGGGGIFRILPGHQENAVFNTYFETQHQLTAQHLSAMFGFHYLQAHNEEELDTAWQEFYTTNEKPTLLEIFTPTAVNDKVLLEYFNNLR